jgi:UDP-3-O-[3-hydroxymyristoyl] N-acetylglucosamine deacetylase
MDAYQRTLRRVVRFSGVGLHSGQRCDVEVAPAPAHHGVTFQRSDLAGAPAIVASATNVASTDLSTKLGRGDNTVATVEHLLAALVGLGVDNARVRVRGPEVPILDGSAAPFVESILRVGVAPVEALRRSFHVKRPFEVRDGDRSMRVDPAPQLAFDCEIEYASQAIGRQRLAFPLTRASFLALSGARTFCHLREVESMRAAGLARGGSLENAVVVDDHAVVNPGGLRSADEFVRHKVLDCLGDLALLGAPLVGKVTLVRNGHGLHARFLRELLARRSEFLSVVEPAAFGGHGRAADPEFAYPLATNG